MAIKFVRNTQKSIVDNSERDVVTWCLLKEIAEGLQRLELHLEMVTDAEVDIDKKEL